MNGNNLLVDTNILLYLLSGDQTVANILQGKNVYISFITELELLGYPTISAQEEKSIRQLLIDTIIIDINDQIKQETISLRRDFKLKLPDAIVAATALYLDFPLISADQSFGKVPDLNFLQYKI